MLDVTHRPGAYLAGSRPSGEGLARSRSGPPGAGAPVAGQHRQADGELDQADEPLEADVPGWGVRVQDTGELQDRHRHPQHHGQSDGSLSAWS
jgi:hypothetical protein